MRTGRAALALACALLSGLGSLAVASAQEADSLFERGRRLGNSSDLDHRRQGLRDLEAASRLDPERPEVWWELSVLEIALGERSRARVALERLAALTPEDARAWTRLGDAWRWDWMATIDDSSFARALRCYGRSTRLDPTGLDAWLGRVGMALARGDVRASRLAAEGAIACSPTEAMSQLAFACVAYRAGALELAEGAFDVAIPRLPADVVPRFRGPATARRRALGGTPEGSPDSTIVWSEVTGIPDPDLTTEYNEAALDFDFRIGLALLLFRGEGHAHWDMRAELIARYGMPAAIEEPTPDQVLEFRFMRRLSAEEAVPSGPPYPYHFQLWKYPALGMDAPLWDRSVREIYERPPDFERSTDALPDPRLLRGRSDLMLAPDGLAVFRTMAPGVTPIPLDALLSRFPAPSGTRLVAHVGAAAGPLDTLWASMVVSDRDGRRVASAEGRMRRSACDPAARQVVQLDGVVPPGAYRVDLSVRFGARRRGLVRVRSVVPEPDPRLRMGDLVPLCGPLELQRSGAAVQLEPDFHRRSVGERDLSVYFEMANLADGLDGEKSFHYAYSIHALGDDSEEIGPALVEAARSERYAGEERRQFITAHVAGLRPGRYRLRIDIRDENGEGAAVRTLDFEKLAAAGEPPPRGRRGSPGPPSSTP
jgi:tetratricopeptide (TPR) repeat protein